MFIGITLHFGKRLNGFRIGVEYSRVSHAGTPYLDRWIIYFGGTLRLHYFFRGDDDRAFHDHPWPFITFPLSTYHEVVFNPQLGDGVPYVNTVRRWRFHYRPSSYRHRVLDRLPFWTIVISGPYERHWGFWPKPDEYVPYEDWT